MARKKSDAAASGNGSGSGSGRGRGRHDSSRADQNSTTIRLFGTDIPVAATVPELRHEFGISSDWTPEEQAILDEGLIAYASESIVMRCAKIAATLQNKSIRDVAMRIGWMNNWNNHRSNAQD